MLIKLAKILIQHVPLAYFHMSKENIRVGQPLSNNLEITFNEKTIAIKPMGHLFPVSVIA